MFRGTISENLTERDSSMACMNNALTRYARGRRVEAVARPTGVY